MSRSSIGFCDVSLLLGIGFVMAATACHREQEGTSGATESTTGTDGGSEQASSSGARGEGSGDGSETNDSDDETPSVEHALGTVTLSEAHLTGGGVAQGSVAVSFVPDASGMATACTETVAGCEITKVPECPSGCGELQYCGFVDGCQASCIDHCTASCDDDEECYFAAPGQSACRAREAFDAGVLSLTGTSVPLTLYPPYKVQTLESGAPFLPSSEISVTGSGATAAGFEAFTETFEATSLLQTAMDEITVVDAYGTGDMPVRWTPGSDEISIRVTVVGVNGSSGTLECRAQDSAGQFDVPRAALEAAVEGERPSSIAVSVTRKRTEIVEGLATTGKLLHAEVQPEGWLALTTRSTESHVVEGCGFAEVICGEACVDVSSSMQHCGACDTPCAGTCSNGECIVPENTNARCSDGVDNDLDGYADCSDFDCASLSACQESQPENTNARCSDGIDNDLDTRTDCADADCSSNPAVTVCGTSDNSCVGLCGEQHPSGACYCDGECIGNSDCCPDFSSVCL